MSRELSRTYTANDGQELTLNPAIVAKYVLGNVQNVPDEEYAKVIMTCAARGLNPLAGDVAVQPHWNREKGCNELSMVMTKHYFQLRAAANPLYAGTESGTIVLSKDGRPVKRRGCGLYKELGEKLLAGWCEVFVKGRAKSEYKEVTFSEFDTGRASWKKMPTIMIEKVAKSQALREAFPNEFQGLYEPEEMGIATTEAGDVSQPIEAVVIDGEERAVVPVPDESAYDRESDQMWQRYERELGPVEPLAGQGFDMSGIEFEEVV